MSKPNCYDCVHRRGLAGDCHSACHHPKANISFLVGVGNPLGIVGDSHGIRQGWFMWPMNFDPVWLEVCNGFEGKVVKSMNEKQIGDLSADSSNAVSPTNATKSTNA